MLAFLKPQDVDEGWIFLQEQAPSNERLIKCFDYFVDQWLENPAVPKEVSNFNYYGSADK